MDWQVIIQIVLEIVKSILDKDREAGLQMAADLQAVAVESDDKVLKLIAGIAMCAANRDAAGKQKLAQTLERLQAVADRAAAK